MGNPMSRFVHSVVGGVHLLFFSLKTKNLCFLMHGFVVRTLSRSCPDINTSERLDTQIREPGDSSPLPFSPDGPYSIYKKDDGRSLGPWFLISSLSFFGFKSSTSHSRTLTLSVKVGELDQMDRNAIREDHARCEHSFSRKLLSRFVVFVSAIRSRLLARGNNLQGLNRIVVLPSGLSKKYLVRFKGVVNISGYKRTMFLVTSPKKVRYSG